MCATHARPAWGSSCGTTVGADVGQAGAAGLCPRPLRPAPIRRALRRAHAFAANCRPDPPPALVVGRRGGLGPHRRHLRSSGGPPPGRPPQRGGGRAGGGRHPAAGWAAERHRHERWAHVREQPVPRRLRLLSGAGSGCRRRPQAPAPDGFEVLTVEDLCFSYPTPSVPRSTASRSRSERERSWRWWARTARGRQPWRSCCATLYVPTAGRILWDGVDTASCDPATLRRHVAVIFQDFVHYQLSARENVAVGDCAQAEDVETIVAAAVEAGARVPRHPARRLRDAAGT